MSKIKIGNIKGPKGDRGEQGAVGPKGEQGIQGPVGPAGGVDSVNGMTGDVTVEDTQGVNLLTGTRDFSGDKWMTNVSPDLSYMTTEKEKYNGLTVLSRTDAWNYPYQKIQANAGEVYTLSLFLKSDSECVCQFSATGSGTEAFTSSTEWKRYSCTRTVKNSGEFIFFVDSKEKIKNYVCGYKLERGTVTNPVWTPAPEDVVTKTPYDIFEALDPIPEAHRNNYRGRNLGESTAMSAAHKAAIQDGSFKDLFVGDYWTHGGINYRIADMDYWFNCGDENFTTHHLVIVPDKCLGENKPMNASDTTEKGYTWSVMHTTTLPEIKSTYIDAAFPNLVLSHKEYFTNAVTSGRPSGGEWVSATVELMNEIMVYGCPVYMPMNNGAIVPTNYTIDNSQLALFRLNPGMIKIRQSYWLRDVTTASSFAVVHYGGAASQNGASDTYRGVRPVFCIGVAPASDETEDDMEVVGAVGSPERMEDDVE